MTSSSTIGVNNASVFCQISGREISPESCFKTQGQDGCFGCAAHTRRCESCLIHFVAVAATGTCSSCTTQNLEEEKDLKPPLLPKLVSCQIMKRQISGVVCQTMQGQDACRGCTATSRICENCKSRPVRFPQYGMCFTCSVEELGEGWEAERVLEDVPHPHLRVVSDTEEVMGSSDTPREILSFAQDFLRIPLAHIREPEASIRTKYAEQELIELGDSMIHDGMIYPVIVEEISENFYEVIIGKRRVRAARLQEATDVPALVVSPQSPLSKLLLSLAENMHRVNLDPFEEAKVFLQLMREHNLDTSGVAKKVKRSTHYVTKRIQLLSLPSDVQHLVASGELSIESAAVLARLPEKDRQKQLARESVTHRFAPVELRRKVAEEIGDLEDKNRVVPYRVTPEKFVARTEEFALWFKRAMPRLELGTTSLTERVEMMSALASLENQINQVKEVIRKSKSDARKNSR